MGFWCKTFVLQGRSVLSRDDGRKRMGSNRKQKGSKPVAKRKQWVAKRKQWVAKREQKGSKLNTLPNFRHSHRPICHRLLGVRQPRACFPLFRRGGPVSLHGCVAQQKLST